MTTARDDELRLLFTEARTHAAWIDRPVDLELLRRLYDLTRMAPTGGNSQPLRVVFAISQDAKERLRPALDPANIAKAMAAPVTAILGYDAEFYEQLPRLSPARAGMKERIAGMPAERRERLAMQSANLQAGYFILAARALGLDCGPMGGFDAPQVDAAFLAETTWRTLLLINLGYASGPPPYPRLPRLDFDDACRIV
jgi:3-hydroxypropanoate dehydrogenase